MHTWRTYSAWLLLTLLTLGGVIAPTLHQLQHDGAHPQATITVHSDRTPHSEIDHSIDANPADAEGHSFYCLLCHTQLLTKLSQHVSAPVPQLTATSLETAVTTFVASAHLNQSLIRGPPVAA